MQPTKFVKKIEDESPVWCASMSSAAVSQLHYNQSDLAMSTTRNSLSLCTPIVPSGEVMPSIISVQRSNTGDVEQGSEPVSSSVATSTTNPSSKRCFTRELFTCLALTSIVIGLPIAIVIVLINLPRLSTRSDTRYIILAGFPFFLVVIVSILYAIFRLVVRIRTGPDHSKYLRSKLSWRRFSRRLRGVSDRPHHHHRHGRHRQSETYARSNGHPDLSDLEDQSDDCSTDSIEPKLYTLVAEVMSKQQHHQNHLNHHPPNNVANQLHPPMHPIYPEPPVNGQRRSIAHLDVSTGFSNSMQPQSGRCSHRLPLTTPLG